MVGRSENYRTALKMLRGGLPAPWTEGKHISPRGESRNQKQHVPLKKELRSQGHPLPLPRKTREASGRGVSMHLRVTRPPAARDTLGPAGKAPSEEQW